MKNKWEISYLNSEFELKMNKDFYNTEAYQNIYSIKLFNKRRQL